MLSFLEGFLGKPGPDRFARMMTRALRKAGTTEPIVYDARSFSLRIGKGQVMNLGNYHAEYCAAAPLERGKYLARVSGIGLDAGLPDSFADVRDALIPRVRERAFYELLPMQYADGPEPVDPRKLPVFRPFAEFMALGVAADFPDRISEISADQLETWGVGFDEALEIGRENLWKRSVGKWEKVADGVWVSPWRDNLDVNRLALPTLFRQLAVDGDPVAFAPNRDHLFVTGSRDHAGQGVAAACANGLLDAPRPMNATPLVLDGLEWKPFPYEPDHPVAPLFRRLALHSLANDYATQKGLLEARFEKEGTDLFVASFMAFENKETKHLRSIASWSETVDTLLPKVDAVVLNVPDGEASCRTLAEVPWDLLVSVVGGRMKRQEGMYPERWRVETFPGRDELVALGLEKTAG